MTDRVRLGKYLKGMLITGDFLILNLAYLIAWGLTSPDSELASKWVWLIANISFLPSVYSFSNIHNDRILYADRVVLNALKSILLQGVVMMSLLYVFDIFDVGARTSLIFFGVFMLLLSVWWVFSRWALKRMRRLGFNFRRAIVIGAGPTAEMMIRELQGDAGYGFRIFGIFDDQARHHRLLCGQTIRRLSEVEKFVHDNQIDIIYYTLSAEDPKDIMPMMRLAEEMGAEFVYVPSFNQILTGQFQISTVGNMPSLTYSMSPLHRTHNRVVKRAFDLLVAIPFLLVSPILFIPIAIGIKLTSKGPVFFKQKRTGIRGTEFICYKFRTMRLNTESDTLQATENDPRKTKFGDFLRRSSLDELPQFINVLIGNMSVVGPRPHMVSHTEEYAAVIDKYMIRHAVKPGITGWAQVNGYRGGTKHLWQMEKRVQYDVWYIRNWNLFLDIKIVFLTLFNSLRSDQNAY